MTEPEPVGSMPVSELIEDAVIRVAPDATLEEAADALAAGDIGALVVGDDQHVSGIVSERDVVRAVARRQNLATTRVAEVANSALIWCDATATVAEVAAEMMDRYVRHVLVEEDGRFAGIVSARDLLGAYATADMEMDTDLDTENE
jgi:CBS domain-containing protein